MEFNSLAEFLAMGRHGLYVWLSYGLTLVIVVVNLVLPALKRKQLIRDQRARLRREQATHSESRENKDAPTT